MTILVDSTVWVDFFNGAPSPETNRLDALLGSGQLVAADLILSEVLKGLRSDRDFERARDALLRLPVLRVGGTELVLASAENYRLLRRKGCTVRATIDCWIATFCLREGLECCTTAGTSTPSSAIWGWRWWMRSGGSPGRDDGVSYCAKKAVPRARENHALAHRVCAEEEPVIRPPGGRGSRLQRSMISFPI